MSINDLLDVKLGTPESFIFIAALIIVVVLLFIVPSAILASRRKYQQNSIGNDITSMIVENNTKINNIRTIPDPRNQAVMLDLVLFEMKDGRHIELVIKDSYVFNGLSVGDCGTLWYKGKEFVSFDKNIPDIL